MAKRTKKSTSRSLLKLEALEQRQLLAGGFTEAQGQEFADIVHPNGNVYDQVLLKSSSITVTNDPGQITRVSFLDLSGDIVQAEFSGAGSLTISLDADTYKNNVTPEAYNQDIQYVQGLASFTISGSNETTYFTVFSVGSATAHGGAENPIFADGKTGGNNVADVSRLTIVANPSSPNGSVFGGIRAGNAVFSDDSGTVGIAAANVQVQEVVRIGDINATGTATPTLVFGDLSQFGAIDVQGGDLLSDNGRAINNADSYNFQVNLVAGSTSGGAELPAANTANQIPWTGHDPFQQSSKTIELTTAIDNLVGTSGNDTFNASHTATSAVVGTLDKVDGAGGDDTLTISDASVGGVAPIGGLNVSNVENFIYTSVGGLGATDTLSTSGWTGLTSSTIVLQDIANSGQSYTASKDTAVNITSSANLGADGNSGTWAITGGSTVMLNNNVGGAGTNIGTGTVTVTGVDGTTSVTVNQAGKKGTGTFGAVNVNDVNADSTSKDGSITSVTLNGVDNASTIKSNALSSLSLTKVTAGVTVDDHIGTGNTNGTTLAVTANESTTSITDANGSIKQVDFTATGKDSTVAVTTASNALTAITVAGDKKLSLAGSTFGSNFATLTSTNTGGITATVGDSVTVTTDAGADNITLSAATKKAIAVGGGDDTVVATLSDGKLGSGGSIDGGEGTDTISLDIAAAVTATGGTTLAGTISNFEALTLTGTAGGNVQLNNLDLIKNVTIAGNNTAGVSLTGLDSGASVTYTSAQSANTTVTVPISAIQNETLNLKISNAAGIDVQSIDGGQINAVVINSDDTANTPTGINHTVGLTSNSLRTITVSGDAGLIIDTTGTGVTSIDGSALSKNGLNVTTGALASAATITGGSKDDTVVATAATKAVTVTTGDGANTVTIANAQANTITGGSGIDTITVGSGNNTITAGGGNDVVSLNAGGNVGANTVDLGDGNDDITIGKAVAQTTITLGGGDDDIIFAAASVPSTEGYFVTISGAGNNDTISFANIDNGTATFDNTKVELGAGVSFSDYLDEAAEGNAAGANSVVRWFQFGGDTFLVLDNSNNTEFTPNVDMVVRLSGSLDLSAGGLNPSIAGGVITL